MAEVRVKTEIYPCGEWHLRIHCIDTKRALQIAEGGFAIARGMQDEKYRMETAQGAAVTAPWGTSAICAVQGYERAQVLTPDVNTNLMAPRTLLPMLRGTLRPGTHTLVCAVLGTGKDAEATVPEAVLKPVYDMLRSSRKD